VKFGDVLLKQIGIKIPIGPKNNESKQLKKTGAES